MTTEVKEEEGEHKMEYNDDERGGELPRKCCEARCGSRLSLYFFISVLLLLMLSRATWVINGKMLCLACRFGMHDMSDNKFLQPLCSHEGGGREGGWEVWMKKVGDGELKKRYSEIL